MAQTVYPIRLHTSASGTNVDEYFPSAGGFINTKGATSVVLTTTRTAETGTCTFQPFGEWYDEAGTTWVPWLDMNDGTQIQGIVYADAALDSTSPFHRFVVVREISLAAGATTKALVGTLNNSYQCWIPERIRFRFRHGGTTVTNSWRGNVFVHTR